MRRSALSLSLASLLAVAALLPARAADPVEERYGFQLRSDILTQVPEVAAALDRVDLTPDDVQAWRELGQALAERAAYVDAINALKIAVEIDPENPEVWVDIGATHLRANDPRAALNALKRALKIEPYHAIAHYNSGLAHQGLRNRDEAFDAFEYALTIDPSLGDPKRNPAAVVNPDLPYVKLRVFMKTTGSSPALFGRNERTPSILDEQAAPESADPNAPAEQQQPPKKKKGAPAPDDEYQPNF